MDIDTTSDTEYTELVEPAKLPVIIASFASNKNDVAKEARQHTDGQDEQFFFTDSSRLDTRKARASVA